MSLIFQNTPDVDFAVKDASEIEQAVITGFETAWFNAEGTHLTLYPADPRRLFLLTIADLIVAQRVCIDFAAKQNLLKYARGDYLDNLGALYGERGQRLQPAFAATTLRFSVTLPMAFENIIPIDTRAASSSIEFATTEAVTLRIGETNVDAPARARVAGSFANNIFPGQVNTLINWRLPFAAQVENLIVTSGGADLELDDRYRQRIYEAAESFSTCGPTEAYHFWAMTASPDIADVLVHSDPSIAGEVWLYPLMKDGGLPSQEILDRVYAACNDERRRPLTDEVHVAIPNVHNYQVELVYYIWQRNQTIVGEIQRRVVQAVNDWVRWERSAVGRDIIPSKLVQMIHDAGVKRVEVIQPPYTPVPFNAVPIVGPFDPLIHYGGLENTTGP